MGYNDLKNAKFNRLQGSLLDASSSLDLSRPSDQAVRNKELFGILTGIPGADVAIAKGILGAKSLPFVFGMANKATKETLREMTAQMLTQDRSGLSAAEQQLMDTFGDKFVREANAAKKVAKSAGSAEAGSKSIVNGNAGKMDPDYFRKLQEQQGEAEVLKQANAGVHLKRQADGGYVGGPRTVTSPQSLGAMRSQFDAQFDNAANAVAASDTPDRVGTWYDRAKRGQAMSNEPYQLPRTLEQHGVYSAGVAPEMEFGFALNHHNSRALGDPQMAYRSAGMNNLDSAVAEDRPARLAYKIGEYAKKNDPRIANTGLFGVNDFRASQSWGYTDPKGNPWRAGASDTMHPFMDAETALAVQRANNMGIGGRTDWNGAHLQEMPWILGKAEDLYSRGYKASYSPEENGTVLNGIKRAVQNANQTSEDMFRKHALSATWETAPGEKTGHMRGLLGASPEELAAYHQTGRWDIPVDTLETARGNVVGQGNRDAIYSALGFRQLPSMQSVGNWQGKHNPMTISKPLVDMDKGDLSQFVNPRTLQAVDGAENFRALVDGQAAYAANLPVTNPSAGGKTSLLLDTTNRNPYGGTQWTPEQADALTKLAKPYGFDPTATSRGVMFRNEADKPTWQQAASFMKKEGGNINNVMPGALDRAAFSSNGFDKASGVYGEVLKDYGSAGGGQATQAMLEKFAKMPSAVSSNLSESEAVRDIIRKKALQDSMMGGALPDVQNTRQFLSEADWAKAVEMIRKGMAPAAAVAALGYSLPSMAETQ